MERVDVVVVGGGSAGLSAAWAAAAGGVRVIVVERDALPRPSSALFGLRRRDLDSLGLASGIVERTHDQLIVDELEPVRLEEELEIHAVRGARLHQHLLARARAAGASIRDRARAIAFELDREGWRVDLEEAAVQRARGEPSSEPIRAPILIVADGARSRTLEALGIAGAQRFTGCSAEVVSFLVGHWGAGAVKAASMSGMRIFEGRGPLGRIEVLPGKDGITVAMGPVWRGVSHPDVPWTQGGFSGALSGFEVLESRLGLTTSPQGTEVVEWRLDALPTPPTFDGGIVIGAAAGRSPRSALTAMGAVIRAGAAAGVAAAKSVLANDWSAAALARRLGPEDAEIYAASCAELELEAHGLRRARPLPSSYWRRPRA